MPTMQEIIQQLAAIRSLETQAKLSYLEDTLDALFQAPHPEMAIDALFQVVERFPDSDGNGIFWSILHGLEHLPDYEQSLVASVQRQPTEFNLRMLHRILNSGMPTIGSVNLVRLLHDVANTEHYAAAVRDEARAYAERHGSNDVAG